MTDAPADIIKELTSGQRRLYGYVLTLVPSPAEADDILQETNLAILRKADTFTPGTNFLAWACRIAFNQAMTYYRKRRRELRPLFDDEVMGALASEAAEAFAGFDERLGALRGCMEKLGERKRELLQRFYFDEQSVAEIAGARGQSEPTVRVTIHRIRGNLLECIRRSLAGVPAEPRMSDADHDHHVDELLEQQIAAVVAGAPSEAEGRALNARLRGDPAARRLYIEHLMLHGQLQWELAQPGRVSGGLPVPPARDSGTVTGAGSTGHLQLRARRRNRTLAAAALAAGVLVAWSLGLFAPGPAARLVDTSFAEWSGPAPGGDLRPQRLHLAAGLAALRFRNGAKVILQGPAEFEVLGGATGRLISGRLVGRAPEGAHGFTINAAGMDVVDLGTEFGVAITAAHQADVQVFEGVVEVGHPGPVESSDRRRLGIGQAVHVDGERGTIEAAEFAPTAFARVMPGELDDPRLDRGLVAWWTFAEASGTRVRDVSGHGHDGELVGAGFTLESAGVPGRVGRALLFDGRSTYITVARSEDFQLNALSIQAWIRPEGGQAPDAQIFSRNRCYGLGVGGNHWFKWYFWDRDALLPWNFPMQRWSHLVATFDGHQRECWIDGVKLGSLASNPPPPRSGEVMIGTLAGRESCVFHGAIDDLRIYDRALSGDEIRALYLRGAQVTGR